MVDRPTIVIYGDSNTWGFDPSTHGRFKYEDRWTSMLIEMLNGGVHTTDDTSPIRNYNVVVEGLNGRTTVFSDGCTSRDYESNGRPALMPILHSHKPLFLVVIALCVNDHKIGCGASPEDIVRGVETLILDIWRASDVGNHTDLAPAVLLLGPPVLLGNELNRSWGFELDLEQRSKATIRLLEEALPNLSSRYDAISTRSGPIHLLQLSTCAVVSAIDGIHFDASQQLPIAAAVADAVRRISLPMI